MAFSVEYREDARLALRELPSQRIRAAIARAVLDLADDPEPPGSDELWGDWAGHRRLPVLGVYRVVYRVDHRSRLVEIVRIGHRGSIYRR